MAWYNGLMKKLLKSPLHGAVSRAFVLLTVTGRRTGKTYDVPVNYVRDGDDLLVLTFTKRTWWRNLREPAALTVWLRGQEISATGTACEDPATVRAGILAFLRAMPQVQRYYGVQLDADGNVDHPEKIEAVLADQVIVRVTDLKSSQLAPPQTTARHNVS